jgi:hypothetical protein
MAEAERWRPFLPIIVLALMQAAVLPARWWAKGAWVLAVVAAGASVGVGLWQQQHADQTAAAGEIAALKGLWTQWDAVSQKLPQAGEAPAASFETLGDALASLSVKVASVDDQIAALREQGKGRSIDDEIAAKLVDYLRRHDASRAVVSCVPNDIEAYTYANQLVTVLRMGGWEARGPEMTTVLGEAAAMGVSLFVRDPRSPEAAKILVDAFTRFNVPYQTGLAASDAIPDTATVELFVAKKP